MKILITGTSRGVGEMLTRLFLSEGHDVFGVSRNDKEFNDIKYKHFKCDLTDSSQLKKLIETLPGVDVFINNAAIARINPFLLSTEDNLDVAIQTNIKAPYLLTQEIAKGMIERKFGRIINITTIGTKLNITGEVQYLLTKAALEKMTTIWAKELYPFGITVNNVGLSLVNTQLIQGLTTEQLDKIHDQLIVRDHLDETDLKHVFDFIISAKSQKITNQNFFFGGV